MTLLVLAYRTPIIPAMTRELVLQLYPLLPDQSRWLQTAIVPGRPFSDQKRAICLADPAFGIRFVQSLLETSRPLSALAVGLCPILHVAYRHLAGEHKAEISDA